MESYFLGRQIFRRRQMAVVWQLEADGNQVSIMYRSTKFFFTKKIDLNRFSSPIEGWKRGRASLPARPLPTPSMGRRQ